jgi:AcrR family transcriptional regulator
VAPELGRRERKKAQTRKALADAALDLFLARGYDHVGVREVADAADVSVTTLFKYFPSKESLVFDLDEEIEAAVVATVRDRDRGTPLLDALHAFVRDRAVAVAAYPLTSAFAQMVEQTPTLRDYAATMWLRHEVALAAAIAADVGAPEDDVACAVLAHVALQAVELARLRPDPGTAVDEIFVLLEHGWRGSGPSES